MKPGAGWSIAFALVAAAAAFVPGCASKLPQAPEAFTIDPPPPREAPAGAASVISLRRVDVAPAYASSSLVYRVGDHAVERDPYASLAAPPSWMLTAAIRGYLKNADFVHDVVSPSERVPVDAALEALASELYGDFTNGAEPAAVLTLQFRVLVPEAGAVAMRAVLTKSYARRIRLSRKTAAAVVAAWNQAVGEIMTEFLGDLKAVLPVL